MKEIVWIYVSQCNLCHRTYKEEWNRPHMTDETMTELLIQMTSKAGRDIDRCGSTCQGRMIVTLTPVGTLRVIDL